MNLPGGWIIATLASICGAIWMIFVYYLMKKSDKILGLTFGILGPMLLILGLSTLFQPLAWAWWVIPGLLTLIFFYIFTEFSGLGRRYKVVLFQQIEKDTGRLHSYILAFFLESVLIASIILIPFIIVNVFQTTGSVINLTPQGNLSEVIEFFQRVTDLILLVLLISSLIIVFFGGVQITKRIWESKLYVEGLRPTDGVILGVVITIFPGLKLVAILAVLLILPLFVITLGMNTQSDFIIGLPGLRGITESLLTLWLLLSSTLGVFFTLQAIVVGGLVGGHRGVAELSRRQNQLEIDNQMRGLFQRDYQN